jgi:CRP-like cAMP-binding protein
VKVKAVQGDGNSLLARLPSALHSHLLEQCELVTLDAGRIVTDSEQAIDSVYFPVTAVLSVLSVMTDKSAVETAVVGREGMAPLAAFHGVDAAAEQVIVQVPGTALRMSREDFQFAARTIPDLESALHRFAQALFTFAAQTSGCNRKHSVIERCARWLLVTHDRVPGDEFQLTHLFLAQMLGVRRSSVTVAAEALREAGAVSYSRGKMRILDRTALLGSACDCYDIIRGSYDRLLNGSPVGSPLHNVEHDGRPPIRARA